MTRTAWPSLLIAAVSVLAAGCDFGDLRPLRRRNADLARQLDVARKEAREADDIARGLQTVVLDQRKQIRTLQRLGPKRLEKLFHVKTVKVGQYTAPADFDGQPGDDGIKVYMRPLDANGDTIKAAGEVRIRLFDLAAAPKDTLIGEHRWPIEQVARAFSGGFLAYHFTFKCPWKARPRHADVTVRLEFIEYLTGKTFWAQKLVKVRPVAAPATQPATKP